MNLKLSGLNMFLKKIIRIFFMALVLLGSATTFAGQAKQTVNILTWWGYIDGSSPITKSIENECNVEISYDEYYSNDEFFQRVFQTDTSYDIIIFSQTVLNSVKEKLGRKNSNLHAASKNYYPLIKDKYLKSSIPNNMVYFAISLTGFLYNPEVIKIEKDYSLEKIFKDAKNNIIVIIDDSSEANYLIRSLVNEGEYSDRNLGALHSYSLWEIFNGLFQGKSVFITNKLNNIVKNPHFAFGFIWSGEAIELISKVNNKLKFLVHPKLSYLSTDLLAQINEKKSTKCVAEKLSGEKFLEYLQNNTFYFSPYMTRPKTSNEYFLNTYIHTLEELPKLNWVDNLTKENTDQIKREWDYVKYKQELSNESI